MRGIFVVPVPSLPSPDRSFLLLVHRSLLYHHLRDLVATREESSGKIGIHGAHRCVELLILPLMNLCNNLVFAFLRHVVTVDRSCVVHVAMCWWSNCDEYWMPVSKLLSYEERVKLAFSWDLETRGLRDWVNIVVVAGAWLIRDACSKKLWAKCIHNVHLEARRTNTKLWE